MVRAEENAHFRVLGRGRSFDRLLLGESLVGLDREPGVIGDQTVDLGLTPLLDAPGGKCPGSGSGERRF